MEYTKVPRIASPDRLARHVDDLEAITRYCDENTLVLSTRWTRQQQQQALVSLFVCGVGQLHTGARAFICARRKKKLFVGEKTQEKGL